MYQLHACKSYSECSSHYHNLLDEYTNPPSEDNPYPYLHRFPIIDSGEKTVRDWLPQESAERLSSILEIKVQETVRGRQLPDGVVMLPIHWPGFFLKLLLGSDSPVPSIHKFHRPANLV
jgi:hypothetical protein